MQRSRVRVALGAAIVSLVIAVTGSAPASASPWSGTEYIVTVTGRSYEIANFNQLLAVCSAPAGAKCTISQSVTASRTVQTSLGVDVGVINAKLGWTGSSSVTFTASCSWVMPSSTARLKAYPLGEQVFYKVTKNVYSAGKRVSSDTSGTLVAFRPYGNGSEFCARVR